jgi:Outer membrane protein beta-barrel domain
MQKYINHPFDSKLQQSLENLPNLPSDRVWEGLIPEVDLISTSIKEKKRLKHQAIFLFFDVIFLLSFLFFMKIETQKGSLESNIIEKDAIVEVVTSKIDGMTQNRLVNDRGDWLYFLPQPPTPKGEYIASNLRNSILKNVKFKVNSDMLPFRGRGLSQKNDQFFRTNRLCVNGQNIVSNDEISSKIDGKSLSHPINEQNIGSKGIEIPKIDGITLSHSINEPLKISNNFPLAELPQKSPPIASDSISEFNLDFQKYSFENLFPKNNERKVKRAIRLGLSTNLQTFKGDFVTTSDYVFEKEFIPNLYQLAIPFEVKLKNRWYFQPEFNLTSKGMRYRIPMFSNDDDHLTLLYLEIPLMLKYNIPLGGDNFNIMIGPSIGSPFLLYGKEQGAKVVEVGLGFNLPIDYGLNFGTEYRYKFKKGELLIDLRYQKTLSLVFPNENGQKIYRQSFTLGLGWSKTIKSNRSSLTKPFSASEEYTSINRWGIVTQWLAPIASSPAKGLTRRVGFASESAINQKWSLYAGVQVEKSRYKVNMQGLSHDDRIKLLEKFKISSFIIPYIVDTTKSITNEWTQINFPIGMTYRFGDGNKNTKWFIRGVVTPILQNSHEVSYHKTASSQGGNRDEQRNLRLGACGFTFGKDYKIAQNLTGQLSFSVEATPIKNEIDRMRHGFLGLNASLWWGK